MPQLGPLEIIAVAVVALIVFGPHRLPEIARTMGRVISEFKRQANELTSEFKSGLDLGIDDDDDEDDDDVPEPTGLGGLYANEDDDEAGPPEPPLTAGAESGSAMGESNGAPAEDRVVPDPKTEVTTLDGSDRVEREGGE